MNWAILCLAFVSWAIGYVMGLLDGRGGEV